MLAGQGVIRAGEGTRFFMFSSYFSNFKIQRFFQNETKFNGFYSKNKSIKIKDGTYVINDEYK